MSNKETKSLEKFKQELKQLFKSNKGITGAGNSKMRDYEYSLSAETQYQLTDKVSMSQRIKTMKDLQEIVLCNNLEENTVEKICSCLDDIIVEHNNKEYRKHAIIFYQYLVQGQYERLGVMRTYFFNIIKNHDNEDNIARFGLFQKLTDNGKNITSFEEDVGVFLLDWMPAIVAAGKTNEFLHILVNFIKYNSAYIDENVSIGIIQCMCCLCCQSDVDLIVSDSLDVLDAIVCYTNNLSSQSMEVFISTLSRTVCLERYNEASWKIMRNLLGTNMGPFCLQKLCDMLQDENLHDDTGLICGIIFMLNMALLSNKLTFIIGYIPNFILPSILKVSGSKDAIILTEVCLCIKWLVEIYGKELKDSTWDMIFIILEAVMSKIGESNRLQFQTYIHSIFNKVESLLKNNHCNADMEKLFSFAQRWFSMMPEALIYHLTDHFFYRTISIEPDWTSMVHTFVSTFLIKETRPLVRIYVLNAFVKVIQENSCHREKEIIDDIIKPYFSNFVFDKNDSIRKIALEFLIEFCYHCNGTHVESILDLLEKVLKAPFELEEMIIMNENDSVDLKIVIRGLLNIFVFSIYELPSSNAVRILNILVSFLNSHYEKPYVLDLVTDVRWMIIDCLLRLRADPTCRIGYTGDSPNNVKYSSYLLADYTRSLNSSISASSRVNSKSSEGSCSSFEEEFYPGYVLTYMSLTNACQVIVTALKLESDWKLLQPILMAIPTALKNRALVFSKYNSQVECIVNALMSMITDGALDTLKNLPTNFRKPEFYGYVIPVLSAFASYHTHLEFNQQQRLIKCLELGLVNKSAPQCITALMICLLEMREAMVKLLPEILLNLSKISATVHVAIPILEFLSLLTTFPQVFANFIPTQYMSIFAIIFPYTNPFKYHHYIVSLAHHVIAVWFLKCRRPLRREFVEYIVKGLKGNVLGSFEDGHFIKPVLTNEDSSNRKRSSSLTEQGNRRKERHMSGSGRLMSSNAGVVDSSRNLDETSVQFHRELTETCIDFMSRVAFTSCSTLAKRHPGSEFILRNGQSSTWLLGNRLITITTSGCTQKPMYNGYCDHCFSSCIIDRSLQSLDSNAGDKRAERLEKNISEESNKCDEKPNSKQLTRHLSINSEDGNLTDGSKSSPSVLNYSESYDGSETAAKSTAANKEDRETYDFCTCWCQGWAEVLIRRPTGNTSWIMRLQNETCSTPYKNPMTDISTLYQASVIQEGMKLTDKFEKMKKSATDIQSVTPCEKSSCDASMVDSTPSNVNSTLTPVNTFVNPEESAMRLSKQAEDGASCSIKEAKCPTSTERSAPHVDQENDDTPLEDEYEENGGHARNPVRRSNSSPEMSSNWKNSFAKDSSRSFNSSPVNTVEQSEQNDQCCKKLGKHCKSKGLRCNCEAIPEEFCGLGTSPPKPCQPASSRDDAVQTASSDVEHVANTRSSSISSNSVSLSEKSVSNTQLPFSCSHENIDPNLDKKQLTDTRFFDKQGLPNDDFEFSRSASTSQVTSSFRKYPSSASYANLTHGLTSSQPHLTGKPPLSPPTYSLRSINKHAKDYSSADSNSDSFSNSSQDYVRNRVHTISVMSPTKKSQSEWDPSKNKFSSQRKNESKNSGVNPSFVFVQLYDSSQFCNLTEKPILIPSSSTPFIQRSLNVFDHIPPYEAHKVAVLYVGLGQANNETEILRNANGSTRYVDFLSKLGILVNLAEVNPPDVFLGGLDQKGEDGKFAYIWKDDIMQVIFHVATLMPNKENDANCNNKKTHIGNDYVTIVYNESGEEYNLSTVKCQFNFACIVVEPLDHGNNQLTVKARDDLLELIGNVETKIVSDKNVSLLARQLALHINLASLVLCSMRKDKNHGGIYASNWLERLRKIKQIKKKVVDDLKLSDSPSDSVVNKPGRRNYVCDFTEYT